MEGENDIIDQLKEITKWLRFLSLQTLTPLINENITSQEQKKVFELSDGERSTRDISKLLKEEGFEVSHQTVANYWKKWAELGLVVPSEKYKGRYEKMIDLSE
jgi:hypothetical protein